VETWKVLVKVTAACERVASGAAAMAMKRADFMKGSDWG
jgi:hypothetical protein